MIFFCLLESLGLSVCLSVSVYIFFFSANDSLFFPENKNQLYLSEMFKKKCLM